MVYPKVREIDTTPKLCGHCSTKTVFNVLAIDETVTEYKEDGTSSIEYKVEYKEDGVSRTEYKVDEACGTEVSTLRLLKCQTCSKATLEETVEWSEDWYPGYKPPVYVRYPIEINLPPPVKDMPINIANTYNEARTVLPHSPKSSAALLRLAVQQLCQHLGKSGKNLNDDIGELVSDGLSSRIQQALDSVRVIGNNAVHPGSIDFNDNPKLVETLFKLVNFIVEEMITRPREIKEIYESLPQNQLDQIEQRKQKSKKSDKNAAIKSPDVTALDGI